MSNILTEIVDGSLEKVALEAFNENSLYSISDYPIGGISQIQMINALNSSQSGLYMVNSVYMCIDDGDNYIKNHCYKFTYLDEGAYQWVDITPWNETITTTLNEINTIDDTKLYSIIDYPIGGITNEQMNNAVINSELYQMNSVYMCIDDGTYLKNHFYKFTTLSWEDVTPEFAGELKDLTLEELESEVIDENTLYNIKDYPIGGISSLQMVNALKPEQIGFYQIGSVYLCTDDYSDYIKHHFYRFDYNEETETYSWVDTKAGADIDKELSLESENPVANKAITEELNSKVRLDGDDDIYGVKSFESRPKLGIKKSLPNAYQEVEYIENASAGAFINTQLTPSANIGVELKFFYNRGKDIGVFGSWSYGLLIGYSGSSYAMATNTGWVNSGIISDNNWHTAICKPNLKKIDDIVLSNGTVPTTSKPMYIFYGNGYNNDSNVKIAYCKIYDGDNLIRDYIPCYRKEDGVIGLYDLINNQFYINEGAGSFLKGNDVFGGVDFATVDDVTALQPSIDDKVSLNKDEVIKGNKIFTEIPQIGEARLPSEFTEVEYIQRNNLEYIEIPYKPTNNTTVEIKFSTNGNPALNTGNNFVFGAANTFQSNAFEFAMITGGFFTYENRGNINLNELEINKEYTVKFDKGKIYVDGILKKEFSNFSNFTTPVNFCIFSTNRNGTIYSNPYQLNIYYLNIYENDELLYILIPCYRKIDNIPGMYDIINNNFYNNSGEGEFVKGNDILSGESLALQSEIPEIDANPEETTETLKSVNIKGISYKIDYSPYKVTELTMDEENIYLTIE